MLKFSLKPLTFAIFSIFLAGCQTAGTGALDLEGYPNINVAPVGEAAAISPQQEYEMLAELNAALAAQPQLSASDIATFEARRKRLAQIAATHAIDTSRIIEAR
ncbi:MAG: hypothetical protein ACRCT6_09375 [Notoacmeibacter sp.]